MGDQPDRVSGDFGCACEIESNDSLSFAMNAAQLSVWCPSSQVTIGASRHSTVATEIESIHDRETEFWQKGAMSWNCSIAGGDAI